MTRVPGQSYRIILMVCKRHLSDCQVYTSRGNATTSVDLISKQTLAISLNCVTCQVVGTGQVVNEFTGALSCERGRTRETDQVHFG